MLHEHSIYLFILIFLIICVIVYLSIKKITPKIQKGMVKRSTYSVPKVTEEFTNVLDVYQGSKCVVAPGSGSESGSRWGPGCGRYFSQFDTMEDSYGEWDITWADKYYDIYEENESAAVANEVSKIKDITPVAQPVPDYGSTLGKFDSDTTKIPWDADNSSYTQSNIVWGTVSEQASRSIYMKTWLQQLISNMENMNPCGEEDSNYCYPSPIFPVSVTDPRQGIALQVAEASSMAVGQSLQMMIFNSASGGENTSGILEVPVRDADGRPMRATEGQPRLDKAGKPMLDSAGKPLTYKNGEAIMRVVDDTLMARVDSTRQIIDRFLGRKVSLPLEAVPTVTRQLGPQLNAVGESKLKGGLAKVKGNLLRRLLAQLKLSSAALMRNGPILSGIVSSAASSAAITCAATTAAAAATAGAAAPATTVSCALAFIAVSIATFVNWFFGAFSMILMYAETLIIPIVNSLLHPGGVCPSGTQRLSKLIPNYAMAIITNFIPMGSFLQLFDPFVCWSPDGGVHLMTPPKVPPFMSNTALSLRYHSKWVSGNMPNAPRTQNLFMMADPLPPNYVWLKDSDLANSPNVNAITAHARQFSNALDTARRNVEGSGSQGNGSRGSEPPGLPNNIAIEVCVNGTVPSSDGIRCEATQTKTDVKSPTFTGCLASEYDDGFNCWRTKTGNCTGGAVVITSGTSWNALSGYMRSSVEPLVCDGVTIPVGSETSAITKWYNERVTCQAGYEKDAGGLLCYAKCPAGFRRVGAICQSTASTYERGYQYATYSLYYDQPYTPETLRRLEDVKIPYCDFSNPIMLDRMAQFYYNQSMNNPQKNPDGTITVQMITGFIGVTSSSELSCDVACYINFSTYDPISGGNFTNVLGCSKDYTDDTGGFMGLNYCYRRFYFILGPQDTQGLFTVTGCTFESYTAPDAMVISGDYVNGSNLIASIPRTWKEIDKTASIVDVNNLVKNIANGSIAGQTAMGIINPSFMLGASAAGGKVGGKVGGATGGAIGGLAGGVGASLLTSMFTDKLLEKALGCAINTSSVYNTVDTVIVGNDKNNLAVVSNNNWWTVDQGPIYELAKGYTPAIDFCQKSIVNSNYCSYKYVIRDVVNRYHLENPTRHIRRITEIEPRGKNGCYYKFQEVEHTPLTNIEGVIEMENEIIMQNKIKDYSTCTYELDIINRNISDPQYPIRSYIEPSTYDLPVPKVIYPTRVSAYKSDLVARFVRVRPPLVPVVSGSLMGDGYLNLSQIAVFDVSGFNVSRLKSTYATSKSSSSAEAEAVVNGTNSDATTLEALWQPATASLSEYWEVDLSSNITISEIVYFGGTLVAGRNIGVRIEFLYSNGVNDTPVYTITLPTDESTQFIPLYSSIYTRPILPVAGPVKIPRPIVNGMTLGVERGCVNRCENKAVIDSVIEQYNAKSPDQTIVKILRGITANTNTCEYQAEVLVQDVPKKEGSDEADKGKRSIIKQYISMTLSPTITKYTGLVFARFVVIKPSFTPGTVLEISKVLVWNAVPLEGREQKTPGSNVAKGKGLQGNITSYNQLYELARMTPNPIQNITDGSTVAQMYPNVYSARSNDPKTFLQIDLVPDLVPPPACSGKNYEIFQIQIVGRLDRALGGMKGIQVELYADVPGDEQNATTGKYAPVFRYTLPTDETTQMITVSPPASCSFTMQSADILQAPAFLQPNVPDFSTTDTSGGVFFFSGMLNTIKDAWSSLQTLSSEDMNGPMASNIKKSDEIVNSMLETVAEGQTIAGTNNTCRDPAILKGFMTSYALSRGPSYNDQFGVSSYVMNRILKAGQSSPNTCDVLFEEVYNLYDEYVIDVTDPTKKGTNIKAVRFIMNENNGTAFPAQDEPNSETQKNVLDIDTNAIGLLTNVSTLSPVFSEGGYMANCRDPAVFRFIKSELESKPRISATKTETTSFKTVLQSFQSTPLSCEYKMSKDISILNHSAGYTYTLDNNDTWVKVIFTLGSDQKTPTLSQVIEYDPDFIKQTSNGMHACFGDCIIRNNKIENEAFLPSLFSYDPVKNPAKYPASKRINTTVVSLV
jgi:hypothetical protein